MSRSDDRDRRHKHHPHFRRRRDFWHAWYEERERQEQGESNPSDRADAWKAFFQQFMGTPPEKHWEFGGRPFNPWRQGMDHFNPFVARLLSKGGGLLALYVLNLLAQKPRYGNEIMDILIERTERQWVANPGAIYPLMTTLEEQGLIEGEWEDPVKRTVRIYNITPQGKEELSRLKAFIRPKLQEALAVLQELLGDLEDESTE